MSKAVQVTMTVFHFSLIASEMFQLRERAGELFQTGDIGEAVELAIDLLADRKIIEAHAGAEGARRVRIATAMLISEFRSGEASNDSVLKIVAKLTEPTFASH